MGCDIHISPNAASYPTAIAATIIPRTIASDHRMMVVQGCDMALP